MLLHLILCTRERVSRPPILPGASRRSHDPRSMPGSWAFLAVLQPVVCRLLGVYSLGDCVCEITAGVLCAVTTVLLVTEYSCISSCELKLRVLESDACVVRDQRTRDHSIVRVVGPSSCPSSHARSPAAALHCSWSGSRARSHVAARYARTPGGMFQTIRDVNAHHLRVGQWLVCDEILHHTLCSKSGVPSSVQSTMVRRRETALSLDC